MPESTNTPILPFVGPDVQTSDKKLVNPFIRPGAATRSGPASTGMQPGSQPTIKIDNASGLSTLPGPISPHHSGRIMAPGTDGEGSASTITLTEGESMISAYDFYGTMSEEVMHRYLDKKLQMVGFCHISDEPSSGGGGSYNDAQFLDDLLMIADLRPKFVGDMAQVVGWVFRDRIPWYKQRFKLAVDFLHNYRLTDLPYWNHPDNFSFIPDCFFQDPPPLGGRTLIKVNPNFDPEIICEVTIGEVLYCGDYFEVDAPDYVLHEFGEAGPSRPFVLANMVKRPTSRPHSTYVNTTQELDITQRETQMWYYFLATMWIDCGCEAIHCGDINTIIADGDDVLLDTGLQVMWSVLQRIRNYAHTHARRRLVLLDSHIFDNPATFNGYLAYYYDPDPHRIEPMCCRQLLFDYHSLGVFYNYQRSVHCFDVDYSPQNPDPLGRGYPVGGYGNSYLPMELLYGSGLLNKSLGGLNPQGWFCSRNPVSLIFDVGNNNEYMIGCLAALVLGIKGYGFDNSSWYVAQAAAYRNAILKYTFYRVKALDPYAHFNLHGRVSYRKITGGDDLRHYRANTGDGDQQITINELFNRSSSPLDWVYHNFTEENVVDFQENERTGVRCNSDLVWVGDKRIYYIGSDGYIHGYIKNNGTYNGGNWLIISPSYAAYHRYGIGAGDPSQLLSNQLKAKSDLVANPDGGMLVYLSTSNTICGFYCNPIDPSDCYYLDFSRDWGADPNIIPYSSIIWPLSDRFYFIAQNRITRAFQIHGYYRDPTYNLAYHQPYIFGRCFGSHAARCSRGTYS